GLRIECYWFNFEPEHDEYNWVDFYKYVCPWGTAPDGQKAYYESECEAYEGWEFNLGWSAGEFLGTTDDEGYVWWSDIPEGQWSAAETPREGWGDPYVWCRVVE